MTAGGHPRTWKEVPIQQQTFVKVKFAACPIQHSLGVIGKKWALLILRDVSTYGIDRFNRLLESLPGISPRVLATRLKELERAGLLIRRNRSKEEAYVRWALTEKGKDIIPIGMMIMAYEGRWYPEVIFHDKRPHPLRELFDDEAMRLARRNLE
jgi:DNA-binding HxlR family transcriptional regulator